MTTTRTSPISLERLGSLYERFHDDLERVRRYMRVLYASRYDSTRIRDNQQLVAALSAELYLPYHAMTTSVAQFDDLEAEITYLLLRDEEPETVVEISPCGGWSTCWILNALRDNGHGRVISFDVIQDSLVKVPDDLAAGIRDFHLGDVKVSPHLPDSIDYCFLDSDHSAEFAHWYLGAVLPRVHSGAVVSVHDIFHPGGPDASGGEGTVVLEWLAQRDVPWLTVARSQDPASYAKVTSFRNIRGAVTPVAPASTANPTVFFVAP
ncbi:MAG: class I SAM-dependent methyltransferase [Planctomycetes bacterium]|nr:class I SAM-dependent methyltransferase [Planctomycetota bacterium]